MQKIRGKGVAGRAKSWKAKICDQEQRGGRVEERGDVIFFERRYILRKREIKCQGELITEP